MDTTAPSFDPLATQAAHARIDELLAPDREALKRLIAKED